MSEGNKFYLDPRNIQELIDYLSDNHQYYKARQVQVLQSTLNLLRQEIALLREKVNFKQV